MRADPLEREGLPWLLQPAWQSIDSIRIVRLWTWLAANEGVSRRILNYVSSMVAAAFTGPPLPRPHAWFPRPHNCLIISSAASTEFRRCWRFATFDLKASLRWVEAGRP